MKHLLIIQFCDRFSTGTMEGTNNKIKTKIKNRLRIQRSRLFLLKIMARWLVEKGENVEANNIWENFLKIEIKNKNRSSAKKAIALLNLIWFEDSQLRELSGPPEQSLSEKFEGFVIGDGFSITFQNIVPHLD